MEERVSYKGRVKWFSNEKGYGVSNLKLQKLLYFVQAAFLSMTEKHEPCFSDEIQAWDFGPVVPRAYHEYKQYGSTNIPTVKSYFVFSSGNFWEFKSHKYDETIIHDTDKEIINSVVDMFKDYSATDLVTLTHNQSPWKDAYVSRQNRIISNKSIRMYFDE